jgi:hypothetical protein
MNVTFTDNTDAIRSAFEEGVARALEKCGLLAERHAKKLCPVDTGNLRNNAVMAYQGPYHNDHPCSHRMGSEAHFRK